MKDPKPKGQDPVLLADYLRAKKPYRPPPPSTDNHTLIATLPVEVRHRIEKESAEAWEAQRIAKAKERAASIDWNLWLSLDRAQPLWNWVALFTGLNPDDMRPKYSGDGFHGATPEFTRLLRIASAAEGIEWASLSLSGGAAYFEVKRQEFIRWAESKGVAVPDGLRVRAAPRKGELVFGAKGLHPILQEALQRAFGQRITDDASRMSKWIVRLKLSEKDGFKKPYEWPRSLVGERIAEYIETELAKREK